MVVFSLTLPLKNEFSNVRFKGRRNTITEEDLKRFHLVSKRYRNRRIGNFLKELQLAEGRNTGIPAIVEAMRSNGSEPPRFETDGERSYFSVILPVHPAFRGEQKTAVQPSKHSRATRRSSVEIRAMVVHQLEVNGPMSMRELARRLGYAKVTNTLNAVVKKLISERLVRLSNPEHPHSQNQALILT